MHLKPQIANMNFKLGAELRILEWLPWSQAFKYSVLHVHELNWEEGGRHSYNPECIADSVTTTDGTCWTNFKGSLIQKLRKVSTWGT